MAADPPARSADIEAVVRRVFDQTWTEYYAWKPPSTLPLADNRLLNAARRLDKAATDQMRRTHIDLARLRATRPASAITHTPPKVGPAAGGSSPLSDTPSERNGNADGGINDHAQSRVSRISSWERGQGRHPAPAPKEGTFQLSLPSAEGEAGPSTKRVPPYSFCVSMVDSCWRPDEKLMPFMPIFPDEVADKFDEEKYKDMFEHRGAWTQPGRDPDVDIIQVETLSRLRMLKLSLYDIDETRILPSETRAIENLDLYRDLPPFPLPPASTNDPHTPNSHTTGDNRKRKWLEPIPVEQDLGQLDDETDLEEIHCYRPGCFEVACRKHAGLVDGTLVSASNSVPLPLPPTPKISRSTIFPPSTIPCSDTCFAAAASAVLDKQQISLPLNDADRDQVAEFIAHWKECGLQSCCDLTKYFRGVNCKAIAETISIVADVVDGNVPYPNTIAGPDIQTNGHQQRSAAGQFSKSPKIRFYVQDQSTDFRALCNFEECKHDGPCVRGICSCAIASWACGRNCGCPPSCQRRFRGCDCRRIERQAAINLGGGGTNKRQRDKVCAPDRCPCQKAQRECDPELCGGCGAREELSSSCRLGPGKLVAPSPARNPEERQWMNCSNVQMQKAQWPKLRVGISKVAGYGLFADEDIEPGRMIGEYVGEIVSHGEGEKRTMVNEIIGRQYIFAFNADSEIDAANAGNPTRFINSGKGNEVNCGAGMKVVRDDLCIVFNSSRLIRRHEEIRFDYGLGFVFENSETGDAHLSAGTGTSPSTSRAIAGDVGVKVNGLAPKKPRTSRLHK